MSPDSQYHFITNISSAILSYSMCVLLLRLVVLFVSAALTLTSLLFFFRVRAVFERSNWVVAFFATSWLAILGGCLAFIIYIFENPMTGNTQAVCVHENITPYVAATTITPLINDTLIFLAISWRLLLNSYCSYTIRSGIRPFILGDHLPVLSKALFRDGQAYYLFALSWCMSH